MLKNWDAEIIKLIIKLNDLWSLNQHSSMSYDMTDNKSLFHNVKYLGLSRDVDMMSSVLHTGFDHRLPKESVL